MKNQSKINFYIFAMRNIHYIVFHIQSLFTYHKGTVLRSFYSNVISVFRNSWGLYPHFFKVNYFLMRNTENNLPQTHKVCSDVTSISRNETNALLILQELFATGKAKLFTITANARYCYIRFKEIDNTFHYAKALSIPEACAKILIKLNL